MTTETKFNFENEKEKKPEWLEKVREYYGGEVHSHSRWSDRGEVEGGGEEKVIHSETRLLEYADKLGLNFVVFSEHASDPGNPVKLPESHPICQSLLKEKERIDEINLSGKYKVQAFSAVEASIFFDETGETIIDVPDSILHKLNLVVASRHTIAEQLEPTKIKESLLAAVNNFEVDIIGHPYRYIEFYKHDWNYFKKYWRKDPDTYAELEELESNKQWDLIKQIIGKEDIKNNERIKELNELFLQLKDEYWQVWDETLMSMEKNGKAFEINLSIFDPSKEFYRSLLERASGYQNLNFSISYDFHNLEKLANLNNKGSVTEKPADIKNLGRSKAVQRLLDLISLLESLNIGSDKIINSSSENLEEFIEERNKKKRSIY